MEGPSLFVSVGTDHHTFDRLIHWTDRWVALQAVPLDYVVQHGASRPSRLAGNLTMVTRGELLALMSRSVLVVTQGGPGSIVDARSCGRKPIVVPRVSALNEVVDDHQEPFCRLMAREGSCLMATDEASLHRLLDRGLSDPSSLRKAAPSSPAARTAATVRRVLDEVVEQGPGWFSEHRFGEAFLNRFGAERESRRRHCRQHYGSITVRPVSSPATLVDLVRASEVLTVRPEVAPMITEDDRPVVQEAS